MSSDESDETTSRLEAAVPESRKHLNGLVDAMVRMDADAHREGRHEPGELEDCPLCQEVRDSA